MQLLISNALETSQLLPAKKWVPWVTINGEARPPSPPHPPAARRPPPPPPLHAAYRARPTPTSRGANRPPHPPPPLHTACPAPRQR